MEKNYRLKELRNHTGLNQRQFAEYFGIPLRTLEDWEAGRSRIPSYLFRLMVYRVNIEFAKFKTNRNVNIIKDLNGNKIVLINDIIFKGKRSVDWDDVKEYLKRYVGEFYKIAETNDVVYIGKDLPDEYTGSRYTYKLMGAQAKAKANATQGIPELLEIATGKNFRETVGDKHKKDAKFGWYRYDSRFALPVYDEQGEAERYNVFHASILIRHDKNGKLYLYDILDIKKEMSNLFQE